MNNSFISWIGGKKALRKKDTGAISESGRVPAVY